LSPISPCPEKWGLAPFPQTQLAATTTNIDAEMVPVPIFAARGISATVANALRAS
jgi:hypothetical protein